MGLTPLSGLPGATRSGDVDPSLIFHFTHDAGRLSPASSKQMHITAAEEILNKKSGWRALAGTTDFGAISARAEKGGDGDEAAAAKLAFDIFCDRILGFVGSYYVKLDGRVDALVFAGGIGEKGWLLRRRVAAGLACLGFELDGAKNENLPLARGRRTLDVGREGARHRILGFGSFAGGTGFGLGWWWHDAYCGAVCASQLA
ncbi:hypothetical protein LTR66_013886 [Elasticomyces elasticus]|nr:hypothetical protein LTR66_013886 [Elasticomyces elasticus]